MDPLVEEIDRLMTLLQKESVDLPTEVRRIMDENRRLRTTLKEIAEMRIPGGGLAVDAYMKAIAREALAGGEK